MICQFCGKQVSDNDTICKYCGSNLTMLSHGAVSRHVGEEANDETIVIPSQSRPASRRASSGAESSYAVRRPMDDPRRVRERRPEPKKEYYRYNPNGDRRNVSRRRAANDRKAAPHYSKNPHGKQSVLKWIGKIILLAIVGISVGMLIYLGVNGITNFVKSIGNHDKAPASVTTPVKTDEEKNNSAKDNSSKSDVQKRSESHEETEDLTEKKSETKKNTDSAENKREEPQSNKNETREESEPAREEAVELSGNEGGEETGSGTSEKDGSSGDTESGGESNSSNELTD